MWDATVCLSGCIDCTLRVLISVNIHNVHAARGPCDSEMGRKSINDTSFNKSRSMKAAFISQKKLPDRLNDGPGIDEHALTERACVRWADCWW